MRETRNAQCSIFDFYSKHELGKQLHELSDLLDQHPDILDLIEKDLRSPKAASTGAHGLSVESVFRCVLLRQIHQFTYVQLAFHLTESNTYRAFVRLRQGQSPGRSSLQASIRMISDQTLESINGC